MAANPARFAELLTEAIYVLRAREGKSIRVIQDELGYAVGRRGGAAIEYYRKGNLPPDFATVEGLARELSRRGRLAASWGEALFRAAGYPVADSASTSPGLSVAAAEPATTALANPVPAGAVPSAPRLPLHRLPEPAPLPPGSLMPLARNPLFVGREQDLLALARALDLGATAAVSQVETAAASGLGGIGKTQLAAEFVHRYGRFYAGGVFWLSFEQADAVRGQIAACGGPGALDLRPDFGALPLDDQVRLVMAAWQAPVPRLLVFDNCEDPALLQRWRPASGASRVLVTSRRGDWESVLGVQLAPLGVLTRPESVALLRRLAPHVDAHLLAAIAEELGDLPLALHLAGSYLHRYRLALAPADYLARLRHPDLLHHPSLQGQGLAAPGLSPTGHIQHVGRTFALSYERLDLQDAGDRLARRLLVCLAHFAPGEPIWYALLVKMAGEDAAQPDQALAVADAFARLVELGLVEKEADQALRMHRLVAAFVREVAAGELAATQARVEQVVRDEMARINDSGQPVPLLARHAHLRAVVDLAQVRDDLASAALCTEWAKHLWQVGNFADAHAHFAAALAIRRRRLGEEHLETADSYQEMGNVLRELGDLARAKQHYQRALAVREAQLGPDHLDTAATLNELGHIYLVERSGVAAERCLRRAWTVATAQLGVDHKLTADYANNLGLCLQDCFGDLEQAHAFLAQALATRQRVLAPDHPLTALSHNNMGYLYQAMDRAQEARHHYEQALAMRQVSLGDAHPDTAQTWNNLGALHREMGEYGRSRACLEEALRIYVAAVGEEHYRTSFCLTNLGLLYQAQGDLAQAEHYFARALAVRRAVYQPDHPNLAISLYNLGAVLAAQGKPAAARPYLAEAQRIRAAALGPEHPLTQAAGQALATLDAG